MASEPEPGAQDIFELAGIDKKRKLQVTVACAHAALLGVEDILAQFGQHCDLESKGGVDALTSLDRDLERKARTYLQETTQIPCFGEEEGGSRTADLLNILDKIDGTPGWRAGIPLFGSGVATIYRNLILVNAVVLPALGECLVAVNGIGMRSYPFTRNSIPSLNTVRKSIYQDFKEIIETDGWAGFSFTKCPRSQAHEVIDPKKILVGADLGYKGRPEKLAKVAKYANEVFYCPVVGSATYGCCAVSQAKLGGYCIFDVDMNDTYPGALLVTEMGGVVSDEFGKPLTRQSRSLVAATNKSLHEFLIDRLNN